MLLNDRSTNGTNHFIEVGIPELAVDLMNDHQPFAAVAGDCEGCAHQNGGMGFLGGLFDVLRVMVSAADDHDVLKSPGDK